MAETHSLVETRGLTMKFGGVVAVNSVNFKLAENEIRCVIGPNGAGKSTFFKCLTGQLRPTAGRIFLGGKDVSTAQPHQIARIGVATKTQVPSIYNKLSVRENIWLAARRHTRNNAEADDTCIYTMERTRLSDLSGTYVERLAHGERQWVELAMVVASHPRLVLLDEPTAGMTQVEVEHTAELIQEINRTAALIVVEHDMNFIQMIAETVTVLHQGAVLIEDSVTTILNDQRVRDVYLGRQVT